MSQWQHTSAASHPKASKWPTYCSVMHRADSHVEKLASEVCVRDPGMCKEIRELSLHTGMQVCECGLADIPFWLITHFASALPAPSLFAEGTFFQLSLDWIRDWWYLGVLQEKLCPFALSFGGWLLRCCQVLSNEQGAAASELRALPCHRPWYMSTLLEVWQSIHINQTDSETGSNAGEANFYSSLLCSIAGECKLSWHKIDWQEKLMLIFFTFARLHRKEVKIQRSDLASGLMYHFDKGWQLGRRD